MEKTFGPSQNDARRSPAQGPKIFFTKKLEGSGQSKLPLHSIKANAGGAREVCSSVHESLIRSGVDSKTVEIARQLEGELAQIFEFAREELGDQSFNETPKHVFLARVLLIELSERIEKIGLGDLAGYEHMTAGESIELLKMWVEPMQDKLRDAYSREVSVEISKFDVGETLSAAADEANRICERRELKARTSVVGNGTLEVVQAQNTILEILNNLIWNASKYSDRIEITYASSMEYAIVSVSDLGGGVPIGHEERLFVEGVRLPNATSDSTGIGLYASKKAAAEILGGDLSYGGAVNEGITTNSPGRGAVFTLHFPVNSPHIEDIQI